MVSDAGNTPPDPYRPLRNPRKKGNAALRWFRGAIWVFFGVLALLLLLTGSLWWWAGTDGSLATTLHWAGRAQPLTAEGVTGALRKGGHIDSLGWQQDGLAVAADDVGLTWEPLSLAHGELTISKLSVGQVKVDDQRARSTEALPGPPGSLQLPLPITLDALTIGNIDYQGATAGPSPKPRFSAANIVGRYAFDGQRHTLTVTNADIAQGVYKATATLMADAPMTLTARLVGELQATLPATDPAREAASVPLKAVLTAEGVLTDLRVKALVDVTAPVAAGSPSPSPQRSRATSVPASLNPHANVNARITPWDKQPVPEAQASFRDLDIAAFVPNMPRTLLTGSASVLPVAPPANTPNAKGQFWAVNLQVINALSGPWDQQRLPLEQLDTAGQWRDGSVALESLNAKLGGGTLVASGQWTPAVAAPVMAKDPALESSVKPTQPAQPPTPRVAPTTPATPVTAVKTPPEAAPSQWTVQAKLQGVNPALLHSAMAPYPLDGTTAIRTVGEAVGFDVKLLAANARVETARKNRVTRSASSSVAANPLSALRLRDATATGSWNAKAAGGTLNLSALRVRTNDAALTGKGSIQPFEPGGNGEFSFVAPGLDATLQGTLRATSGKGSMVVRGKNASVLLDWLKTLPGMPAAVTSAKATGSGSLNATWAGGWRDPAVSANLDIPLLDIRLPGTKQAATGITVAATANTAKAAEGIPGSKGSKITKIAKASITPDPNTGTLKLQGVQARLSGKLSQAQLSLNGNLMMDKRRVTLQLAADGGRSKAGSTLATSTWQGSLRQLAVTLADPALGSVVGKNGNAAANSVWTLFTRGPVSAQWSPLSAKGTAGGFESGTGTLAVSAPAVHRQSVGTAASTATQRATVQPAVINLQPIRWRPNSFASAGTVTGLPLAWAEVFAGPQQASTGVSGDLLFNGEWDALLTDTLRLNAKLARASGDVVLNANSIEALSSNFSAGIRTAEVTLANEGNALRMTMRWDTARAGSADGSLTTRLSRTSTAPVKIVKPATIPAATKNPSNAGATPADDAAIGKAANATASAPALGGWTWATDAPINGQLRAQLPKVGVWSVLAPPGWRLRGSLGANILISGTRGAPQLAGTLQADDMALRSVVDGFEFGSGKLRAKLDGTRLIINEFTLYGAGGPSGGGLLTAQGEAGLVDGKPNVLLNAKLKSLRASIRTDRQLTVSGDIQARLQGATAEVTGALVVDQALIELPDESTPKLGNDVVVRRAPVAAGGKTIAAATPKANTTATPSAAAAQQEQKVQKALDAPLQPDEQARAVKLAVDIDLGKNFRVRGKGIDTRLRGTLAVTGDAVQGPRLVGTLNTAGGQYRAYGQRLDVERGVLRFTGALDNPTLDILALRADAIQVSQRVGVQITGTALLPRIRLYAQPDLPDAEKLAWLITGKPTASGGAEVALLQQAALALLGSKTGDTGGGLASSLGLDELSFKGGSNNADGSTSEAAVTLGKRFSRNFYAAYERSVTGALGTLYIFYDLSKRFTVRAQAGQQSAIDLIYTLHYD